ncbi:hypothetical protein VTN00DRAFT_9633 [Thermoascus crustaceus]|uniref:uncharacterized protein n=1 Tax=Thermoascus crustaceus TaxID=5088 RepID=UPI003742DE86
MFVTQMLTGILHSIGEPAITNHIHKCTRDDVLWKDAFKPWRRSPLWLLVRVGLQTSLMDSNKEVKRQKGYKLYKWFMIFFMSRILQDALKAALPSDTLFIMSAKISRRTLKLGLTDTSAWLYRVHEVIRARPLQFSVKLPSLQTAMSGLGEAETEIFLADVELWTADHLGFWLAVNIQSVTSCVSLADLLDTYISIALLIYITHPDDFSLMILTCMDMWVALDRCVVHHIPLLRQYQPPFPSPLFEPLLTPTKAQMEQLWSIKEYLGVRRRSVHWSSKFIFKSAVSEQSFGVHYFDNLSRYETLRAKIKSDAEEQRSRKKAELTEKQQQYNRLIQESMSLSCQYVPHCDYLSQFTRIHDRACQKCNLEREASSLMIGVHEWPLPEETAAMKSAVFELDAPVEFTRWRDTTYCILIDKILDIVPSTMTGMAFEIRHELFGWQVHLCMVGSELIIRASKSGSTCELIPTHALQGDFPQAFVNNYTHWRDLESGVIKWRLLTDPWNSSAANWRMQPDRRGGQMLVRGKSTLIDIASPTAEAVNSVLGSLESMEHIHMFFNEQDGTVDVQLPRMKLDFFLHNKGQELESKQFHGMIVDRNQSIGTFTGLTTKLVLHHPGHQSHSIIVPHGTVHFSLKEHHICVVIDSSGHKSVPYHQFQVDTLLGRLVDNGSLISKLFKSYLHATTAHCLPDTLTGKTGTEQALAVLREASTRSLHGYRKAEFEILRHIAQLTPQQQYYPRHLRVMHKEEWTNLSPLSHHNVFFTLASSLWDSACDHHSLFGEPQLDADLGVTNTHLLGRASIRDSAFRIAGFGAADFTYEHDTIYNSRDYVPQGHRESQARRISSLVDAWSVNLSPEGQLLSTLESWQKPLRGPDLQSSELAWLGYSSRLLDCVEEFLPDEWCTLAQIPKCSYSPKQAFISFMSVFGKPSPPTNAPPSLDLEHVVFLKEQNESNNNSLEMLLQRIGSRCSKGYKQQYVNDLLRSLRCLRQKKDMDFIPERREGIKLQLEAYLGRCRKNLDSVFHSIRANLEADCSITDQIVMRAGLWPRLSPTSLLCHLVPGEHAILTDGWKYALVQYALALTTLQHAERLVACINDPVSLTRELETRGHEGWDPMQYPEWLVLEVESNILIREQQARITLEMVSPSSGTNSIMQLNMGEGKSSVIVPMVAAALADGAKLTRVIVLRPLLKQMFDVLLSRVGSLLNRQIFQFPISRSLRLDGSRAHQLRELCRQCMEARGILLVQPDHLLSFELMGLEQLISGKEDLGMHMVQTQLWLENNSHNILDESDEILNTNYELIYTIGTQRPIDMSPDRWTIVQSLLRLVSRFANTVLEEYPGGLKVKSERPGSPPCVRVLQTRAGRTLLLKVAAEVCTSGLPGVPLHFFSSDVRDAMLRFITNRDIAEADMDLLRRRAWGEVSTRTSLLLLRGLLSGGVLTFALEQKHWRVNYGHNLSQTMLAVPYQVKDTPAPRAEFSHPDATITLTCLAYYASGLSDEQLRIAFERLLLCDHAQEEYDLWVQYTTGLPPSLHRLTGVNLKVPMQCSEQLFPPLQQSKATIDFYMSQVVFPAYMKEFPQKISASGWNIARSKVHLTTGFSGTNDSSRYLDADTLLQMVVASKPPVHVILDVSAQVLELQNEQVASAWLALVPESEAQAVIFFNDLDELSVLDRDGEVEMLKASPFSQQMDQCLVYLNEAHTRGTDLQLPTYYRAAVTLGPGLTRDRLVQACMRMRKLGKGQSLIFCAPMEIQEKILKSCGKDPSDKIDVADVLA